MIRNATPSSTASRTSNWPVSPNIVLITASRNDANNRDFRIWSETAISETGKQFRLLAGGNCYSGRGPTASCEVPIATESEEELQLQAVL